jgi:hypothetical protein
LGDGRGITGSGDFYRFIKFLSLVTLLPFYTPKAAHFYPTLPSPYGARVARSSRDFQGG